MVSASRAYRAYAGRVMCGVIIPMACYMSLPKVLWRLKERQVVERVVSWCGAVMPGVKGGKAEALSGQVVQVGPGEVEADGVAVELTGDEEGSSGASEGVEDGSGACCGAATGAGLSRPMRGVQDSWAQWDATVVSVWIRGCVSARSRGPALRGYDLLPGCATRSTAAVRGRTGLDAAFHEGRRHR